MIWNEQTLIYTFGEKERKQKTVLLENILIEQQEFISTNKADNNINIITNAGYLWDTAQKEAIEKGNLVHNIMALISTQDDVEFAFSNYLKEYKVNSKQIEELKPLVNELVRNPKLKSYFDSDNTIYNERDIISKDGSIIRPDRLVILPNNDAVIIDYKSGAADKKHELQLINYEAVLTTMNFNIIKKILIYINNDIQIKEF
jgi:predicted Ser/Thr protein kinase